MAPPAHSGIGRRGVSERVETSPSIAGRLVELLAQAGQTALDPAMLAQLETFYQLLVRWNARTNLTAIRDQEGILRRHFLESIICARALPPASTLLDFGSGAGFPGIPAAICRPEVAVTLAESQGKKAAFLREAVRTLGLAAQVHSGRAETLGTSFDCVTLRAVDKMELAVRTAASLVKEGGWLAVLTTDGSLSAVVSSAGEEFSWADPVSIASGTDRILALGRRRA